MNNDSISNNIGSSRDGGRTLILCFDGTSDAFDDTNTNVVRLFSYLEKREPDKQLVYYQTGVGTYTGSSFVTALGRSVAKTLDLGLAVYLPIHVIEGYQFLQHNYQEGDKICLFGFSRGAYTARALAGMLSAVGLLPPDMLQQVHFAYEMYRKDSPVTRIRTAAYKAAFCRPVSIEFIGCWDTVASVGAVFPRILPFSGDNHITKTFRHALALDEHRAKFRSNTWHRSAGPSPVSSGYGEEQIRVGVVRTVSFDVMHQILGRIPAIRHRKEEVQKREREETERMARMAKDTRPDERPPTDVKEVWFAGCHCDVGGGNTPNVEPHSLANIPLRWMIKEILLSDTPIIFRKSYMLDNGINLDDLVAQAEQEKRPDHTRQETLETALEENGATPKRLSLHVEGSSDDEHPSGSTSSSSNRPSSTSTPSQIQEPPSSTAEQQDQYRADAVQKITDQLKKAPAWWILEFVPFIDSKQMPTDEWVNRVRINLFRPRDIPCPPSDDNPNSSKNVNGRGVNIPPVDALFHRSVKVRMEAEECAQNRPWWKLWGPKKTYYRPRAMRKDLKPVYVD